MQDLVDRWEYEAPSVELLGRLDELTGSGGSDNPDGWGPDICA